MQFLQAALLLVWLPLKALVLKTFGGLAFVFDGHAHCCHGQTGRMRARGVLAPRHLFFSFYAVSAQRGRLRLAWRRPNKPYIAMYFALPPPLSPALCDLCDEPCGQLVSRWPLCPRFDCGAGAADASVASGLVPCDLC